MTMTQYELDHIDERADKEILELISCAVSMRRLLHKPIPERLKKRLSECLHNYDKYIPEGYVCLVMVEADTDEDGQYVKGGKIQCHAVLERKENVQ